MFGEGGHSHCLGGYDIQRYLIFYFKARRLDEA